MPRIEPVPMEHLEPDVRQILEAAVASGMMGSSTMSQIVAYNRPLLRRQIAAAAAGGPASMGGCLDSRLVELLRLRSAQLGGCEECAAARYGDEVSEDEITCMIVGQDEDLSDGERLALRFMTLMHTDHHSIGDDFYRELATVFSTAEIIELCMYAASSVGLHRLLHTWDLLGTSEPALTFDESQILDNAKV